MIAKIWSHGILRKEAGEEIEGGGGAGEGAAEEVAGAEAAESADGADGGEGAQGAEAAGGAGAGEAAPEAKGSNFLANIRAGLLGKGALLTRAELAEAALNTERAEVARLTQENAALQQQVETLRTERQAIEQMLDGEKQRKDAVAQAAAEQLEQHGFKVVDLPAAESHADTLEGMMERMSTEKDPKKKFELAAAINAKRWEIN